MLNFDWVSLACGHFRGAKPSRNVERSVIELDLRINLQEGISPKCPVVINRIIEVTGLSWGKEYSSDRWNSGNSVEQSIFYGYRHIGDFVKDSTSLATFFFHNNIIELEVSVQRQSEWLELSNYWSEIFSPEEVEWQAYCRQALRDVGIPYEGGIQEIKRWQCNVARWRLLGAYATGLIDDVPPEPIRKLVESWENRPYPEWPDLQSVWVDSLAIPDAPLPYPVFAAMEEGRRSVSPRRIGDVPSDTGRREKLRDLFSGTQAILFDLDGVLHPHQQLPAIWEHVWPGIFLDFGVSEMPTQDRLAAAGLFGLTSQESLVTGIAEFLKTEYDITVDSSRLRDTMVSWLEHSISDARLNASCGAKELLDAARQKSLYLSCVSNSSNTYVHNLLARLNLSNFFDSIVTSDDVGAGWVKPSPRPWETALDLLGLVRESRVVIIEENRENLLSALSVHPDWRGVLVVPPTSVESEQTHSRVVEISSLSELVFALKGG